MMELLKNNKEPLQLVESFSSSRGREEKEEEEEEKGEDSQRVEGSAKSPL